MDTLKIIFTYQSNPDNPASCESRRESPSVSSTLFRAKPWAVLVTGVSFFFSAGGRSVVAKHNTHNTHTPWLPLDIPSPYDQRASHFPTLFTQSKLKGITEFIRGDKSSVLIAVAVVVGFVCGDIPTTTPNRASEQEVAGE